MAEAGGDLAGNDRDGVSSPVIQSFSVYTSLAAPQGTVASSIASAQLRSSRSARLATQIQAFHGESRSGAVSLTGEASCAEDPSRRLKNGCAQNVSVWAESQTDPRPRIHTSMRSRRFGVKCATSRRGARSTALQNLDNLRAPQAATGLPVDRDWRQVDVGFGDLHDSSI